MVHDRPHIPDWAMRPTAFPLRDLQLLEEHLGLARVALRCGILTDVRPYLVALFHQYHPAAPLLKECKQAQTVPKEKLTRLAHDFVDGMMSFVNIKGKTFIKRQVLTRQHFEIEMAVTGTYLDFLQELPETKSTKALVKEYFRQLDSQAEGCAKVRHALHWAEACEKKEAEGAKLEHSALMIQPNHSFEVLEGLLLDNLPCSDELAFQHLITILHFLQKHSDEARSVVDAAEAARITFHKFHPLAKGIRKLQDSSPDDYILLLQKLSARIQKELQTALEDTLETLRAMPCPPWVFGKTPPQAVWTNLTEPAWENFISGTNKALNRFFASNPPRPLKALVVDMVKNTETDRATFVRNPWILAEDCRRCLAVGQGQ